ncbi:MAG TPA: hypothetical protein VJX69_05800 [Terriglobales bacterium]|nr:hypothetical protein [Terriglobales bacterium]
METITFYSYKGGTGRSLALANAAVYLAKLGFKVVAVDFDLEAPGLHYKLSRNEDGSPLRVERGVVDYVNDFVSKQLVSGPIKQFLVDVTVPGIEKPLVHLMPAGRVPSAEYWTKLSRINWHELFYKEDAQGVQIFRELQARILDEIEPDFLLVDSRTGITEMGGVATTLLADKVLCLVSPTLENLEGARAVLRSLKRSRRETGGAQLEIIAAVSRFPEMRSADEREREVTDYVLSVMNEPAEDEKDTLALKEVFVLHSEAALQLKETLRVGSGMNPDDSILLRDYLRLFAPFVPKESIEPKLNDLIEKAWEKLRTDPDAAVKDMEQYAESFCHPETYRELLKFYQVRNVPSSLIMRRAQRLWEITRDPTDLYLWAVVSQHFQPSQSYPRKPNEWYPNLDFIRALWRDAGNKDVGISLKIAQEYNLEDRESDAADVLLEVINEKPDPPSEVLSRCIFFLDVSKRGNEAERLIQQFKSKLANDSGFASAWAKHILRTQNKAAAVEITGLPVIANLTPYLAALLYGSAGNPESATALADAVLAELVQRDVPRGYLEDLGALFRDLGRWDDFEKAVKQGYPEDHARSVREGLFRPRRK